MKIKKMRKKVNTVDVFGETFKIKLREENDEDCLGDCDSDGRIITINPELKGEILIRTLAHEFTHAALDTGGICELLGADQQEAVCRVNEHLVMVFLQFFKDIVDLEV